MLKEIDAYVLKKGKGNMEDPKRVGSVYYNLGGDGRHGALRRRRRPLAVGARTRAAGAEQQMVGLARAPLTRPCLVLLDEPSMGLAPKVVEEIFEIVRTLNQREGVTFLLAEQNATLALRYADHGYLIDNGRVVARGPAEVLRARPDVREFYLGIGDRGRRRFGAAPHPVPP